MFYKGLIFNVLVIYQEGGFIYVILLFILMGCGILQEIDFDCFVLVIVFGVIVDGLFNNFQIIFNCYYWENGGVFIDEMCVYDVSYVKLCEIFLFYVLFVILLENFLFGKVQFMFFGQNLWFDVFGFFDGVNFDLEVISIGVGNICGFELMNVFIFK